MPFRQVTVGISHAWQKLVSARGISQHILDLFPVSVSYECKMREAFAQSTHFSAGVTEIFTLPGVGMT